VEAQDYLNITQQIKNIAKNTDLLIGIQNVFDKTQNNLYMPLNPRNRQDIPVSGRSFWMSLSYKF
jgi:outer membrane receptor protein involved in Fe transport